MPREWRLFISDIRESCQRITSYTQGMGQKEFFANQLVVDAVLRNLSVIGEAAMHVPEEIRQSHASIDWRKIIAFRNVAMHEYFGLDRDIVWDVVSRKVPELAGQLAEIK